MAAQLNDTVGIYPQQYEEKKMEERIQAILKERFGRDLDNCTKSEIFEALMVITKQEMAGRKRNTGNKKLYYISAEFLIGKLLSNNLINLGMYEEVEKALAAHGQGLRFQGTAPFPSPRSPSVLFREQRVLFLLPRTYQG